MSNVNQQKLKAMAAELAKDVKTQGDLAELSASLLKMTVEAALGAEMKLNLIMCQMLLNSLRHKGI